MRKLSTQEKNTALRRVAGAISELKEGEDAIRVLSRIYCQNLPDKSPRQGDLMARQVFLWMRKFQEGYEEAMISREGYVREYVTQMLENRSLEEQCALLRQHIAAFRDPEEKSGQPTKLLDASEAERDILFAEAVERILRYGTSEDASVLLPADGEAIPNRNAAKACIGEEMLQAIMAMVIYTMAKNGELSGFPKELTLAQTVIGVCTEEEFRKITFAGQRGMISRETQAEKSSALWTVCFTLLAAAAVGLVAAAAAKLITDVGVLAVAGYILFYLGVLLSIAYYGANQMAASEPEEIVMIPVELYPVEAPDGKKHESRETSRTESGRREQKELEQKQKQRQKL